jgi:heat shock protein HslJ
MLVKENPEDDWTLFYDQIEGFEYEEGYEYELRILEEEVEDPPADASAIKWTLVEVASRTQAPAEVAAEGPEGTTWTLDSYVNGEGQLVDVLPDTEITAEFQDGQIRGNAGCNTYFGSYQVDGNSLSIGPVAMTEMYCFPEELMAQETDYLAALGNAASYQVAEGQLHILDAGGQTILAYSTVDVGPSPLVGTPWGLVSFSDGRGTVSSLLVGTEITALFGEDGSLTGSAGCNNYATSVEIQDNRITVTSPVASTMMMCPEPVMEQERAYLGALESVAAFQIEGDVLELTNAAGQATLTFKVIEPTPLVGTPWQAGWYNNGKGGFASVVLGTEITALFDADGNVSGSAGCNNYSAGYEVDGPASAASGTISIGPAATTRMMCAEPEGIMEQENAYLAALQSATNYQIEGDQLLLTDADGTKLAQYKAQVGIPGGEEAGLTTEVLGNMEYQSEWTQSGTAPLTNGEYREQAAPGSATETIVRLTDHVAYGLLNGQDAAAVVLVTDPGGSGTFYDLAIVVEQDGQPTNLATTSLGDRVQISSLAITGNEIVVEMVTHGPDDPMCCPTQKVVQTYALEGDQLMQTSNRAAGSDTDAGLEIVGVVWKWEEFLEANDNTIIVNEPERYTLEFLPDGGINVLADCNMVQGTYSVSGSQLTIELGPSTMAACPPGSLADDYSRLLQDVNSYLMDGDKLALAIKYDTGIMKFAPDE